MARFLILFIISLKFLKGSAMIHILKNSPLKIVSVLHCNGKENTDQIISFNKFYILLGDRNELYAESIQKLHGIDRVL